MADKSKVNLEYAGSVAVRDVYVVMSSEELASSTRPENDRTSELDDLISKAEQLTRDIDAELAKFQ
jgi:hypothetical protein